MPSPAIISQRGTGGHFTGIVTGLMRSASGLDNVPDPGGTAREVHESSSPGDLKRWILEITNNTDVTGTVTVSGATFEMRSVDGSTGSRDFDLRQVLATVVMAELTWLNRTTASTWTTPGAFGTSGELAPGVIATATFSGPIGITNTFSGASFDTLLTTFLNAGTGAKLLVMMTRSPLEANDGQWNEFAGPVSTEWGPMLTIPYTVDGGGGGSTDDAADFNRHEGQRISYGLTR